MDSVDGYFERVLRLLASTGTDSIEEAAVSLSPAADGGVLIARLRFPDRMLLSITLTVDASIGAPIWESYSFHLQDAHGVVSFRYDNAPHHPHIATHPHHKHVEGAIVESEEPSLRRIAGEVMEVRAAEDARRRLRTPAEELSRTTFAIGESDARLLEMGKRLTHLMQRRTTEMIQVSQSGSAEVPAAVAAAVQRFARDLDEFTEVLEAESATARGLWRDLERAGPETFAHAPVGSEAEPEMLRLLEALDNASAAYRDLVDLLRLRREQVDALPLMHPDLEPAARRGVAALDAAIHVREYALTVAAGLQELLQDRLKPAS